MLNALLCTFVKLLLWLRYRVRIRGLNEVVRRGTRGILFLPNHPALIDPVIVTASLYGRFAPRVLADRDQIDRFFIRWLARRIGVRPMPDIRDHGPGVRAEIEATISACRDGLLRGENLILYPAGHIYRSRFENLRGNSAVEFILRSAPNVRVVLVRTRGLWGSRFSLAFGKVPDVAGLVKRGLLHVLANLVLFLPRREVSVELYEPPDLPRNADRQALNSFLERFYNTDAPPNTYVPISRWESGRTHVRPDPEWGRVGETAVAVPAAVRERVSAYLCELAGVDRVREEDNLTDDLGLDSLNKAELVLWLAQECGAADVDVDALQTVGDVLLATRGEAVASRLVDLSAVPKRWFPRSVRPLSLTDRTASPRRVELPPGGTITGVFLAQARRGPGRPIVADQISGMRTYRDVVTGILALRPALAALPGERLALMLPASVAAGVVYLATLWAGKVPVLLNWTTGPRGLRQALEITGAQRIVTARSLVSRLQSQGVDLSTLTDRFVYLEDVRQGMSRMAKLAAGIRGWFCWASLRKSTVRHRGLTLRDDDAVRHGDRVPCRRLFASACPETAAILLTSGSESTPKAVPLTHANLLANLRDVLGVIPVREDDCLLGFLPPFHSFGLTVTTLLPLLAGVRAAYHANPTQAWMLARMIAAYRATMVCGTPTFLSGIARAATGNELATVRLAVTGAEKCPPRVYQLLAERCPNAVVLEGYGITECSPIVAVNRADDARPGTIGRVLPSLKYAIVELDADRPQHGGLGTRAVARGEVGMLLVRGPSVFGGYLGSEAASPFVEFEGERWYRTGDLVSEDAGGVLTFRGRLKRFVKLGGEMISLPAIEAVLEQQFAAEADEGPLVAVEASPEEEHPEIVLFTTRALTRQAANDQLRLAGLSPLHNISRVVRLERIPVLGTGKTDYRALKSLLAGV